MNIWYRVKDLDTARSFYIEQLGFQELYLDDRDRWMRLGRENVEVNVAEGETDPESETVATLEVKDVKAEAERLRAAGVKVGVVLEIPGTIRLLDVFDPDGNRLQLTQDV